MTDKITTVSERCDCEDWKADVKRSAGEGIYLAVHGFEYSGKPYAYCPWCGNKLKEQL